MIQLREKLQEELDAIHPKTYFQHGPRSLSLPYVIFNFLPSFMVDSGMESMLMDVDVWGDTTDTYQLETLAQAIWQKFNRYEHVDDNIFLAVYRDSRFPELEDDNPSIRRRKMTFQIRYMYKGGTE